MKGETCTISLSLSPTKAKALEVALRDTEEALGAVSLDLEEKYLSSPSQTTEEYREATEAILEAYKEELRTVNNGRKISEEAKIEL